MEGEERDLDARYKKAATNLDAENKAARAELATARKALARERGELASKARSSAAEAEATARKVCAVCVTALAGLLVVWSTGCFVVFVVRGREGKRRITDLGCFYDVAIREWRDVCRPALSLPFASDSSSSLLIVVAVHRAPAAEFLFDITPTFDTMTRADDTLGEIQHAEAESLMRRVRERERQGGEEDARRENDRYGKCAVCTKALCSKNADI